MFREVARKKQVLPFEECLEILKGQLRGVLAVNGDDGYPYAMPLNHYYDEKDGCLYFHGGKKGHRIDALRKDPRASYCVMDEGRKLSGEWWLTFRSVIVFGKVELIEDEAVICDIAERLSHRFTDDDGYIKEEIENSAANTMLLKMIPEHITGKIVREK